MNRLQNVLSSIGRITLRHPTKELIIKVYRKYYLHDPQIKLDALTVSDVLVHLQKCPARAYETLDA